MPAERTALVFMAARTSGSGLLSNTVDSESVDRFRLGCTPHVKYEDLLGPGADSIGRALAYLRKFAYRFGLLRNSGSSSASLFEFRPPHSRRW